MKRPDLLLVLSCLAAWACGADSPAGPGLAPSDAAVGAMDASDTAPPPLAPPPKGKGFQLTMETVARANAEVWTCLVGTLPNTETANVNWVELEQTPGTHHVTLSTLGLSGSGKIKHGSYDCKQLYGNSSLMKDQIMFYGNQGVASSTMHLPKGVVAQLPPGLDLVYELHYVNTTDHDVKLYSRLNAWTIPDDQVVSGIWGGSVRDETITLPPKAMHTEWSRCVMNTDVDMIFIASHMHRLGRQFEIRPFDGKKVGELMYANWDWQVPKIQQFDPPLHVPKGQGFEWRCTWNNASDKPVMYGEKSSDEMCNLAVVFTPFDTLAACEVVETSDGVLWHPDS